MKKPKTMQIAVYALLLIIVLLAMFGLKYFAKGKTNLASNGAKADTIHAAIVYGPESYRVLMADDGNDSIVGINYHLLEGLEKDLGVKVVMHPVIDREQAMAKVASGEYDIFASLPADNYLKQDFLTSRDIFLDRMVLIQLRNPNGSLPANSALDLEGDTIHVEKGSAAKRRLENLQKEIGGNITLIEEPELSEEYLAMKVAKSTWRYAVINEKTAQKMKEQYPDLDYSTPVSFTQFQVWILPQGKDSLLKLVNKYLDKQLND